MERKVALVTGGVGGIGTAICQRLARDGHFVVANYANDDETDTCPGVGPGCPQCADGSDNDGDSMTDYPNDPACASPSIAAWIMSSAAKPANVVL